mmetsp:Transcript_6335/g.25739  ORF Transcript_6335/g.25739 Transcript_6335/m.25739 type:complete len:346 (+) Transcript_6335:1247-2284(+)
MTSSSVMCVATAAGRKSVAAASAERPPAPAFGTGAALGPRQDECDVIPAAVVVGRVDQRARCLRQGRVGAQQAGERVVVEHVGQAVRAKQEEVARLYFVQMQLHQHGVFDAHRARDEVLVAGERGFLDGQQAGVDLFLQQRVIAGDLRQPPRTQPVGARVAHVAEQQALGAEHAEHQGRAHAGVARVGVGGVEDRAVGVVDADLHRTLDLAGTRLAAGVVEPAAEFAADEAGQHLAGHLAGVVAPHAVGEHGQVGSLVERHGIFVVVARAAHVGRAEELQDHGACDGSGGSAEDRGFCPASPAVKRSVCAKAASAWLAGSGTRGSVCSAITRTASRSRAICSPPL